MMKKRYKYAHAYRRMHTTAERRANGSRKDHDLYGWARPARSGNNLPNTWDDHAVSYQKSWKHQRETQYRVGKRGKENRLEFSPTTTRWHSISWTLKEYFEENDIPFRIRELYRTEKKVARYQHVFRVVRYEFFDTIKQVRPRHNGA